MNSNDTKVLKFGGSSVSTAENINKVIDIIIDSSEQNKRIIAVFSAFGKTDNQIGITDLLLDLADKASMKTSYKSGLEELKKRHLDIINILFETKKAPIIDYFNQKYTALENLLKGVTLVTEKSDKSIAQIVSFGEDLSSFIIYSKIKQQLKETVLLPSKDLIKTSENYLNARVNVKETTVLLQNFIEENASNVYISPGFIASNSKDEIVTLGRGGSDYTAALFAAIINVDKLEIWTDVSGMYTCDPNIVKGALPIEEISYKEAMELSYFGAKVLYPPTIQPVLEKEIPIQIKNTFKPEDKGTLIENNNANYKFDIRGISNIDNIALINIEGPAMVGVPGFSARLFDTLAKSKINIILITQASSEHAICFGMREDDVDFAKKVINAEFELELSSKRLNPVIIEKNLAIIAAVGSQMKNHKGIAAKVFKSLGDHNINIIAIAQGASERNISFVINKKDINISLQNLHRTFFEKAYRTVNMFIAGTGNIGKTLIKQMIRQDDWLYDVKHIDMNIFAIANSKEMIFDYGGIRISKMNESSKHAEPMNIDKFIEKTVSLGYPNSIFVDNTASREIALNYHRFLEKGISVVTSNKIAFSENYDYYINLRRLAIDNGANIRYETTVGAALPIIKTIRDIIYSGDTIVKIEGIFSGSLNYIFSNYDTSKSFASVVKEAQEKGYTEPDPRIDLSGIDVSRKMLILARESENKLEQSDLNLVRFLPTNCIGTLSVEHFYEALEKEESYFVQLYNKAKLTGAKLKFVSIFERGELEDKKTIELLRVNSKHPLYNVNGTSNSILIYTERYGDSPLVIAGAGAGKEVTAMGVFADIISLAK
jgi:aspartokinase/homoserine dehydrogenase 1